MKKFISPETSIDTAPYWQFLRQHELRLQRCSACERFRFPPLPSCPECGRLGGQWELVCGRGDLYSWTVIYHPLDLRLNDEVPFTMALVELAEGPRIGGRLIGTDPALLRIGLPVKARFDDLDSELTLINFEPL